MEVQNPNNGELLEDLHRLNEEEFDSNCSTPYVSAPSSPSRTTGYSSSSNNNGYFFSCPASPMHFIPSSSSSKSSFVSSSSSFDLSSSVSSSFEFEFSGRFSTNDSLVASGSMISADELFLNGKIRPMKLSSHLQRPQILSPLLDVDEEEEERTGSRDSLIRGRDLRLRNRSLHRRARSLSPLRNSPFQWHNDKEEEDRHQNRCTEINEKDDDDQSSKQIENQSSTETTPSSSRSSSSGRSSKRWEFLKDFLRSKSEGRGNGKEKFWLAMSFSPAKERKNNGNSSSSSSSSVATEDQKLKRNKQNPAKKTGTGKPTNGIGKRRNPQQSPHEIHYTRKRAQAEEMKKKTYLPYRQGLLGCLGFSSKSYGAMNGFARALNPVSSR